MSGEKKSSSSSSDVARGLQRSITTVRTLPTGTYKSVESVKRKNQ
jgi:hypothetical protein